MWIVWFGFLSVLIGPFALYLIWKKSGDVEIEKTKTIKIAGKALSVFSFIVTALLSISSLLTVFQEGASPWYRAAGLFLVLLPIAMYVIAHKVGRSPKLQKFFEDPKKASIFILSVLALSFIAAFVYLSSMNQSQP